MKLIDADAFMEMINENIDAAKKAGIVVDGQFLWSLIRYAINNASDIKSIEWTLCSNKLPKINDCHISKPCFIYRKDGIYAFAELKENIFRQIGWNCKCDNDYYKLINEVIAWMPLPEPWKGINNDISESY
jgi:hypothetical protein